MLDALSVPDHTSLWLSKLILSKYYGSHADLEQHPVSVGRFAFGSALHR